MAVYLGRNQITLKGGIGGSATNVQYQTKSVDPTTTSVSVKPDDGYTLSEVVVNPIPTNFIGSAITKKSAQEYTPGNSTITINAGQYLSGAQTIKPVPTETKSVTSNGTYSPSTGKYFSQFTVNVPPSGVTLPLLSQEVESTDQVLSGYQLISSDNTVVTGTMPEVGQAIGTISTKDDSYRIAPGYHDGTGSVSISEAEKANLIAANIKKDVSILGVTGTCEEGGKATLQIATADGAGSTTLSFTGLSGNPTMYSVIATETVSMSYNSGGIVSIRYDGTTTEINYGKYQTMSGSVQYATSSIGSYSNGTLTLTSNSTYGNFVNGVTYKLLYITDTVSSGSGSSGGSSETTVNLQSNKTVTPTAFPTTVTPDSGYDGMSKVTINSPTGYVKPTGTLSITTNGTYDVTAKASVSVSVSSSSSSSGIKIVKGTQTSTQILSSYSTMSGSIKYSASEPTFSVNTTGTSISMSLANTTTLSNISSSTNFSVLSGKYITAGTTSSTIYYIPSGATFTVNTEEGTYMTTTTVTCDKAQKVTMSLS